MILSVFESLWLFFLISTALFGIKLGVIEFDELKIVKQNEVLTKEISTYCSNLSKTYSSTAEATDRLKITRSLYSSLGIDPTKTRPSSEALLRRVLKGKSLYNINSLVDICNLCSLHFLLSLGLYDRDKIVGETIKLRKGKSGENYAGIGKENINITGKFALVDKIGPFGNPSADSYKTKITLETIRALFVVFVPFKYEQKMLNEKLNFIEEKVLHYHNCRTVFKALI